MITWAFLILDLTNFSSAWPIQSLCKLEDRSKEEEAVYAWSIIVSVLEPLCTLNQSRFPNHAYS